tara:strand:- start:824 stop:1423 length:600 start_codon:yes stop_codon:yes gene_type:complete
VLTIVHSVASEDFEDIRRVLAICFRDGEALDALDIERILSFDMEWVNPSEAEKIVQALIGKGWLSGEENALQPTVSLRNVQSPLGWFPRPSRLLHPVDANDIQEQPVVSEPKQVAATQTKEKTQSLNHATSSSDPRAKLTQRLSKYISKASEISLEEVERRAKRKQQALRYASTWICLALVAREQNLSMKEITDALATV